MIIMNETKIELCTVFLVFIAQVLVCFLFFWRGSTNHGSLRVGIMLFCSFLVLDIPVLHSTIFFKK